ncbi:MAG: anaerobic C4-dicarboxylate transporter [Actinomycetaceae bacterium]|nr:anaerobic C4-dicarboxylate transporter [Actinomycetaceae bacterium]
MNTLAVILQIIVILGCLLLGTHYGGMGLGLISGIGLTILVFVFHLKPGDPPIDVMLTILAVIGCASTLQASGGLDVLMQYAERLLRRHPSHITILGPLTTWTLTVLCGTGHVVYTMLPIISDIAVKKNIRPERPMAISSVAAQVGITASPVSVATVSLIGILNERTDTGWSVLQILVVSIPASLSGVILAALWSMRRGKDLDDDPVFQEKLKDPAFRDYVYANSETLIGKAFPREAYRSVVIFFSAIALVVVLGAFSGLRPEFPGEAEPGQVAEPEPLSMTLTIQMLMLLAGAVILLTCKVDSAKINQGAVYRSGMTAIFSVFGVAWMTETFMGAHIESLEDGLADVVRDHPWTYAIVLFIVSKLVNSQAAALLVIAPLGLQLGLDPVVLVGFYGAAYGYFILPTYPSDLAAIGFDRTGTTHIGKFIINHSFLVPGFICVITSCLVGTGLSRLFLG